MERQLPKNVRQIGNVSGSPKIYVEDYVDTFLTQMCEKCDKPESEPVGAFLVGDIQEEREEEYIYIYGAIGMKQLGLRGSEYVIEESTWKQAYEDCRQYFEDGELLGWAVIRSGASRVPDEETVKLHKRSFPRENTVFIQKDPLEKDELYYVHKMNDLMEIGGHYTYYEKNPCMQNYMISMRKKNGVFSSEAVEDRAAKNFRNLVRERGLRPKQKRAGSLMYGVSACLVLIVVVMGVSMLNSFERMNSVQSALETLAGAEGSVETRETGGAVTAVLSEEQQISTGEEETDPSDEAGVAGEGTDSSDGEGSLGEGTEPSDEADTPGEGTGSSGGAGISGEGTGSSGEAGILGEGTGSSGGAGISGEGTGSSGGAGISGEGTGSSDGTEEENGSSGIYVVEKGDTLAIISWKMYGDVSHIDAICRMNGIENGNLIYEGQKLLLP